MLEGQSSAGVCNLRGRLSFSRISCLQQHESNGNPTVVLILARAPLIPLFPQCQQLFYRSTLEPLRFITMLLAWVSLTITKMSMFPTLFLILQAPDSIPLAFVTFIPPSLSPNTLSRSLVEFQVNHQQTSAAS